MYDKVCVKVWQSNLIIFRLSGKYAIGHVHYVARRHVNLLQQNCLRKKRVQLPQDRLHTNMSGAQFTVTAVTQCENTRNTTVLYFSSYFISSFLKNCLVHVLIHDSLTDLMPGMYWDALARVRDSPDRAQHS